MSRSSKKGKMSNRVFTTIWSSVLAVLLVAVCITNYFLTGPLYTVMNMYFGKSKAVISNKGGNSSSQYYKSNYPSKDQLQSDAQSKVEQIEGEGLVLLKNDNNVLPLSENGQAVSKDNPAKVTLFGRTSVDPIYTGSGSATTQNARVDYRTAFEKDNIKVNDTMYNFYKDHPKTKQDRSVKMMTPMGEKTVQYKGRGFVSAAGIAEFVSDPIAEVPAKDFTSALPSSFKNYNDAAIVVLGRVGGEGCDLPTDMSQYATDANDKNKTYLQLNTDEISLLKYVKQQKDAGVFKKVVVILNTANTIEAGFLNDPSYGIDAALWVGCFGDNGASAIASALTGKISPSGRLVDTYLYNQKQDPTFQNFNPSTYTNVNGKIEGSVSQQVGSFVQYEEGIYVGYRYYETAAAEAKAGNYKGFDYSKQVQYPFGYGLSYTSFHMAFDGTPTYSDGMFTFKVKVTNSGKTYSGKQVVQIYSEAPYTKGGIEKSKVVLSAFAKTDVLAPGQSQTLTLTIRRDDLASYDYKNNKCYVLDPGAYKFYLSDNAHSWNSISISDTDKYFEYNLDKIIYNGNNHRTSDAVTATNQFDNVSAAFKDKPEKGFATNMSRDDFAGTFPTAPTKSELIASNSVKTALETPFDPKTDKQLGDQNGSLVYASQTPKTDQKNGLGLVDLRGLDYNDKKWESLLDELSLKDMTNLLANAGYNTAEILNIAKPASIDYDGAVGWSTWVTANGGQATATGFAAVEILAATFNTDLARQEGEIIGEEGLVNGFNGWYAPAANTHRSAFGGRNYEYYSEDGLLSGKMAAGEVSGAAQYGTYSYLKHFAMNDKEDKRMGLATFANEQAIREIYLRPFEICVKEATTPIQYISDKNGTLATKNIKATTAIMSSYNLIGTTWSGGNYSLLTKVLKDEWGFRGMVLTDYYGGDRYMSPDQSIRAGANMMLNTFANGMVTDFSSPTGLAAIRSAVHGVLYAEANSSAMQGVAPGARLYYPLSGWQKCLIAGDIVFALILIAGIVWIVYRRKKNKHEEEAVQIVA